METELPSPNTAPIATTAWGAETACAPNRTNIKAIWISYEHHGVCSRNRSGSFKFMFGSVYFSLLLLLPSLERESSIAWNVTDGCLPYGVKLRNRSRNGHQYKRTEPGRSVCHNEEGSHSVQNRNLWSRKDQQHHNVGTSAYAWMLSVLKKADEVLPRTMMAKIEWETATSFCLPQYFVALLLYTYTHKHSTTADWDSAAMPLFVRELRPYVI